MCHHRVAASGRPTSGVTSFRTVPSKLRKLIAPPRLNPPKHSKDRGQAICDRATRQPRCDYSSTSRNRAVPRRMKNFQSAPVPRMHAASAALSLGYRFLKSGAGTNSGVRDWSLAVGSSLPISGINLSQRPQPTPGRSATS
jgi:hypothetical protein